MRRRPPLIAALTAALVLGPALPATSAPAPQAAPLPAATPAAAASPDYDGDGKADVAAVFISDIEVSVIRVWYGSGRVADITHTQLGIEESGVGWGIRHSLLARDLNGDGYTDLVATGHTRGKATVHLIWGSATGLQPGKQHSFVVSTNDDTSVQSLALVESPVRRLAVGLSTYVEAKSGAYYKEELRLYRLTSAGKPTGSPLMLRPGSGKVPKLAKGSDFGHQLASWGNQLFVGAPGAKVSGKNSAGAVIAVTLNSTTVASVKTITQATKGVTGAPDKNDNFGWSIAARDGYLVVGTPRDHVGKVKDTGSIQVFSLAKGKVKPVKRISQSSSGIPGKAERYDRFGSSVALGTSCSGVVSVLVGASGEVIAKGHENDGSAWVIPLRKAKGCRTRQLYEGHGLPGKPGYRDLGNLVGVVRDRGAKADDLVIAGYGSVSEGPISRLFRVSGKTGKILVNHDNLFNGLAGR